MVALAALLQSEGLAEACGIQPGSLCRLVFNVTGSATAAKVADVVSPFLTVIVIALVAFIANRLVRRIIHRSVDRLKLSSTEEADAAAALAEIEKSGPRREVLLDKSRKKALEEALRIQRRQQRATTLGSVLDGFASVLIWSTAFILVLGEFGISLAPFIASAGIIGVALGFGAQSLVKDFLTGVFILIEDQYGVGDIVDVGEASGVIEEVNLRITKIRDVNGTLWFVPNGEITRVANKSQAWARAVLDVDVAYDTDLDHAVSVIKSAADSLWEDALPNATILEEPEIWGVEEFGPDAISIRLVVKVEPAEQFAAARELRRRLKEAFDREQIEIPFPQRTVWLHPSSDSV